jgi:hypothetical protein
MNEHPDDRDDLGRMLARLRGLIAKLGVLPDDIGPFSVAFREGDGRGHRIVVPRPAMLACRDDLAVVAFFGVRRPEADSGALHGIDSELIDELAGYPEMVAYSSLSRDAHRGGNLVLATCPRALERWSRSAKHERVARQLAPLHYTSVRIHQGTLPGGVVSSHPVRLSATRQLEFGALAVSA